MRQRSATGLVALVLGVLSCSVLPLTPEPEPSRVPPTEAAAQLPGRQPTDTSLPQRPELPEEAILILEPGPGSVVASPLHVAGLADPAWEQTLSVAILSDNGSELASGTAMIKADTGQRGPFEADLDFTVAEVGNGFLRVSHSSPRDGGLLHLASIGLTLAPEGPEKGVPQEPHPEDLVIFVPEPGASIQGGTVHVEGFGIARFEQTLLVDVLDEQGAVLGSQPVIVDAPEWGTPGPFAADVPYAITSGAGRVVVRDVSPAFGGDVHLASVEIRLMP